MVQDAQRRIIVGIIPVHHGPNKSSGPSPIPAVPDAAIPAVPPDAAPEENRHRGGRHHGDSRRRNRHTSAAVHRRDRRAHDGGEEPYQPSANEPTNSYGNASPSDPNQADPEPTATVYRMDERPGYESMVTYVTDKLDHYKDEILNNNTMFMSEYRIPDTQDGTDYMTGYMAALLGTVNEAKAAADETSEDPDALDAKIDSYRTTVDTLEARFKKGQALGVSMTVTGNDGKKYTVDGSKSITLRPTWDELEQRVAKASNSLGSGNAASAQKLVELADMKLSWDIDEGFRQCPAFAGTDDGDNKALTKSETFGFYCPATPNVIYGNRSMPDWNMTYAPAAGVRHELSHHAIHMRCGTIEPEAIMQNGVNRTEGVTNSYAVKYMGANRALIQQSIDYAASTGHKQYRMDAFTDRAAERIHSGQCNAG